jgi:hypothetical protein
MTFTEEEARQALTYAQNGAMFMYRANQELVNEITRGGPAITGLPKFIQQMIMTRDWINIDEQMIIKYCTNKLDKKNKYIFDRGDVKVIPEPISINIK